MTEIVTLAPLLGHQTTTTEQHAVTSLERIRGGAISIGNFDGVHQGHANLLERVRRHADRLGGPAIAVVLDPHPALILRPDRVPPKLTSMRQRVERMGPLGIDYLVKCETSVEFLKLPAAIFFQALVVDRLDCQCIVEGPNFFFGRDRGGDVSLLGEMCRDAGIALEIVDPTNIDSEMISSTRIRERLQRGEIEQANHLLGNFHQICGTVVRGDQRGRRIGFPTANLAAIDVVIPAPGVYGGTVWTAGHRYLAAIHIGSRPTFDESCDEEPQSTFEVHLLDYTGDLYDQLLTVDLVFRVRDVARFDSADDLARQLNSDIKAVRERLASLRPIRQ